MDPYEVLGVPHDATQADIKLAFKVLAQRNHPDKAKDEDERKVFEAKFALIREAYDLIGTTASRERFDSGQGPGPLGNPAEALVMQAMQDLLMAPERIDLVTEIRARFKSEASQIENAIDENRQKFAFLTKRKDRLVTKGHNLYVTLVENELAMLDSQRKTWEQDLANRLDAITLIGEYNDTYVADRLEAMGG